MRLFFAVDLDEPVRVRAGRILDHLRARFERDSVELGRAVKWVRPENLHLTLHFLGELDAGRADEILAMMREPLGEGAFSLEFDGLGMFPASGPPRVLWLGVATGQEALGRLHAELGHRLERLSIPTDRRPLSAHLTLARFRYAVRRDVGGLVSRMHLDAV
jgi:2'-5' RNA ligase